MIKGLLPKVVLFDWDGTLVDTSDVLADVMNKTLLDMGREDILLKGRGEMPHLPRSEHMMQIFGDDWMKANEIFSYHINRSSVEKVKLYEGVNDVLKVLDANGHMMGVISNKINNLLKKEINFFKLSKYFNIIVGSGDTKEDKPSPEPVNHALKHLGQRACKDNIVLIGDSITDLRCANSSGIGFIRYGRRNMEGFNPAISVDDHKSIIKLFGYSS